MKPNTNNDVLSAFRAYQQGAAIGCFAWQNSKNQTTNSSQTPLMTRWLTPMPLRMAGWRKFSMYEFAEARIYPGNPQIHVLPFCSLPQNMMDSRGSTDWPACGQDSRDS